MERLDQRTSLIGPFSFSGPDGDVRRATGCSEPGT
jgi:hypothetical protein